MEHKLRSALPPRTAWTLIGVSVLFWALSVLGLLKLPASAPSMLTFFWLYLNALAVLLSAVAVAASVAALVLHRRRSREPGGAEVDGAAPDAAGPDGAEPEAAESEAVEETDLGRLMGEEPPLREPGPAIPDPPAAQGKAKPRVRRKRKRG